MKLNKYSLFLSGFFVLMVIYWAGLQFSHVTDSPINLFYSFSTAILAFTGGIFGLLISKRWGGSQSSVGKAVLLMSLGTTSWSLGNFIWSFYNFILHQNVPYPSFADIVYLTGFGFWIVGVWHLAKATGAEYGLRKLQGKMLIFIFPTLAAIISYYVLFVVARNSSFDWQGGFIKIILDFAYPFFDWVILSTSLTIFGLSLKYLGGKYKWPVITILFGFVINFFADFSFSYTTTVGTYYNGNISDLLFVAAMFTISFGIASLYPSS